MIASGEWLEVFAKALSCCPLLLACRGLDVADEVSVSGESYSVKRLSENVSTVDISRYVLEDKSFELSYLLSGIVVLKRLVS